MTTDIRQQAEAAAKMIDEINAVVLPDPSADLIPLPQADAPTAEQIRARMAQIDMGDTNSIVSFGSSAQAELQQISQAMLQGVKNKDVGPAGDSLREIVGTIRGFSVDELDPNRKLSWWERLFGKAKPIHNFIAKYEQVQDQIDRITENLLSHEHALMKDIKSLDLLYEKTLDFYHELALFIAAGEEKLRELDEEAIPAKAAEVDAAPEGDQILKAQELRDDLSFMTDRADELATRLEAAIAAARGASPSTGSGTPQSRTQQPRGPQAPKTAEAEDERGKSKAELLRALQGMR